MLNQQINLYQERFKEKKIFLSATHMLIVGALLVVGLATASFRYNHLYAQTESKNLQGLEQNQRLTGKLEGLKSKLNSLLAENKVDEEINHISQDIAVRKRMIEFVASNQFGSGRGFSDDLGELSEFKIDDVWLNEISLGEDYIKLSGSALSAENIPEYFNLLRSRDLFKGQVFDVFKVNRQQSRGWKVDFVIASNQELNE